MSHANILFQKISALILKRNENNAQYLQIVLNSKCECTSESDTKTEVRVKMD